MADRAAFLQLARDRFKQATEADTRQIARELEDLRFYAGEQWDKDLLDARKGQTIGSGNSQQIVPARPSLTINKTREPVNQVLNQERSSEFSVELVPADDWGDTTGAINHEEIELREGLVRRIQRDSEAADARTWAFKRSTIAGRGYWLVNTRFVPGKTWDKEVYIHRIYNQASVTLDPAHEQPDGSDARWGFIGSDIPWEQYRAEYGERNGKKNRLTQRDLSDSEWRSLGDEARDWFTTQQDTRFVRVVDYYYEELHPRTLCLLVDGTSAWQDELPDHVPPEAIRDRRTVVERRIKWAKIDGCNDDVLDETDWPGHYLPIIKVVGEELIPYDKERRCEGIVRPMEDPCRGNNYIISKFVERIGLTPIPPYMIAGGQDEGYTAEWDAINTRTLGRVHYNQVDEFERPAPPPIKLDSRADVADLAAGVQLFNDAIVSTSRVPETALGHIDPSVKSGKLAKALIQQAEQGSSNYLDNLKRSMRHEARVTNDLLFPTYGRPGRLAKMMNPSGEMTSVVIGQPMPAAPGAGMPSAGSAAPAGMPGKTYTLTENAEFNVAVTIARSTDTRRREIFDTLVQLAGESPEQMAVIGDLLWKYSDTPDHEELERRYKVMLAPPIQALLQGQQQLPPQVQAHLAQMQQQMAALQQLADKNKTDLMKVQMQEQADSERAAQQRQTEMAKAELASATTLGVAQAKADAENFRSFTDALETKVGKLFDLHMQGFQQAHEAQQSQLDRTHEMVQALVGHQQALEQGQQQGQIASQQAVQAAALAPPPAESGAGA